MTKPRVFVKSANIDNSHALTCPSLRSALFPSTTDIRWALDGYLVGTWWSLLAAALYHTISSLAIRQIVDRARASERYVGLSPLLISSPSFIFFSFLSSLLLFLSFSFVNKLFSLFSLLFSLFPICIDVSRIKKGARDRSPGIIHGDAASDLRASSVNGSRFLTVIDIVS